jgi:glycine oxidase
MARVVVVGGGIAGASVALFLAEGGAEVSIVDAEQPGGAATSASGGMLAPQYEALGPGALYRALVECRSFYPTFAAMVERLAGESLRLQWAGMLIANLDADEHLRAEEKATWQRAAGEAAEMLDPAAAMRIQPGVTEDAVSYLWLPDEGQVDSQQLGELLPRVLAAAGVRVLANRKVRDVQIENGRVEGVELTDDRFLGADSVVVAAGAWSGAVGRLPVRVPIWPVRGHLLRFASSPVPLDRLVAGHAGRVLIPRRDGSVLAGSSMEDVGFDRSTDADTLHDIHAAVTRLVPAFGSVQPVDSWADLRPMSPDGLPIIGADPEAAGILYATGYGRTGILMSPLAGRVVADLVLGRGLAEGWEHFSPHRLHP